MAEELVGAPAAADRLGLTSERIRQLAKAGELPPAAGRVGRQDLWRWQDLLDWAVAQGRVGADAAGLRQRVRAWAPGRGRRRRVVDEVLDWDGGRSYAHVRIWEAADDTAEPAVVVVGNLEDSQGQSATNGIEDVAMLVAARYLGPAGLQAQYYDHWSRGAGEGPSFAHVTFSVVPAGSGRAGRRRGVDRATAQALGGVLAEPAWRETTAEEVERLVGERVEVYSGGTYTAAMVRAVKQAGGDVVDAVWDPEDALPAARAYLWMREADAENMSSRLAAVRGPAMRLLAWDAVRALERAAADLAWQDPDAPVRLHLPALPAAGELRRRAAGTRQAVEHEDAWTVVAAARERLTAVDDVERRLSVPALGGGLTRLAWWEAGVPEPRDPHQGMGGQIVATADLLNGDPEGVDAPELILLHATERAAVRFLEQECHALRQWDVPVVRPAGPFPASLPTARRYLDGVMWGPAEDGDRHRVERLLHQFELRGRPSTTRRSGPKIGQDLGGRLVVVSGDGKWFTLEWPVGAAADLADVRRTLPDATVRADVSRVGGSQPVWVDLPDQGVVPLPSSAGWTSAHEYTWGYSGTGPSNLAAALNDLLLLALDRPDGEDVQGVRAAMHAVVRSGGTPAWLVRDLLTKAEVTEL